MMATALLVDTDVLIDYLRGQADAVEWLENLDEPLLVSAITVAELFAGVRDGPERVSLDSLISAFEVVPIDTEIATQGGLYRRDHLKSHQVGLADALIAASAAQRSATLVTLNARHFPYIGDVLVPYHKA
jgi:predicted nucleic acid-binding protein